MAQPIDPVPAIQRFLGAFDAPSVAIKTDTGVVPLTRDDLVSVCDEVNRLRAEVHAYQTSGAEEALQRIAEYAQELADRSDALEAGTVAAQLWNLLTGAGPEHDPAVVGAAMNYLASVGVTLSSDQAGELLDAVIAASTDNAAWDGDGGQQAVAVQGDNVRRSERAAR